MEGPDRVVSFLAGFGHDSASVPDAKYRHDSGDSIYEGTRWSGVPFRAKVTSDKAIFILHNAQDSRCRAMRRCTHSISFSALWSSLPSHNWAIKLTRTRYALCNAEPNRCREEHMDILLAEPRPGKLNRKNEVSRSRDRVKKSRGVGTSDGGSGRGISVHRMSRLCNIAQMRRIKADIK